MLSTTFLESLSLLPPYLWKVTLCTPGACAGLAGPVLKGIGPVFTGCVWPNTAYRAECLSSWLFLTHSPRMWPKTPTHTVSTDTPLWQPFAS